MAKQTRPAKIICIFNEKGGSSKSTTTCNLAGTLGRRGFDVLVADLDSQQTAAKWLAKAGGTNIQATIWPGFRYGEKVTSEFQKLVHKYDVILVDCAPSVENPGTWATLLVCDLAVITTKLGPPDMDALPAAKNLVKRAHLQTGRDFPVRILPCATKLHMVDDKAAMESLRRDAQFPCTKSTLGDRKAFTRAMLVGATAHSIKNGEEAVAEIERLADEVLNLVGLPTKTVKGN